MCSSCSNCAGTSPAIHPARWIHLIATDPAAPLDLAAWCHLTGHRSLGCRRREPGLPRGGCAPSQRLGTPSRGHISVAAGRSTPRCGHRAGRPGTRLIGAGTAAVERPTICPQSDHPRPGRAGYATVTATARPRCIPHPRRACGLGRHRRGAAPAPRGPLDHRDPVAGGVSQPPAAAFSRWLRWRCCSPLTWSRHLQVTGRSWPQRPWQEGLGVPDRHQA